MSPTPTKRVAIFARVSTFDKGQDPETQLLQLREYAGRRGFDIAGEYVDHATGTNEDGVPLVTEQDCTAGPGSSSLSDFEHEKSRRGIFSLEQG